MYKQEHLTPNHARPKCMAPLQVGHSDGVVAERTRWKTVATGRVEEGIIGNIFKVKMILFCGSCTGKELVENMVGAFFMS